MTCSFNFIKVLRTGSIWYWRIKGSIQKMGPSWFIHCMAWVRYFILTNLNVIDTSMSFSPNCHSTLIESIRFWISNFSSVQYLTQYISIWIPLLNARTSWILWNKTCYRPFLKILFASLICVSVHQNNWLYFSKITMNLQFFCMTFFILCRVYLSICTKYLYVKDGSYSR